MVVYLLLIETSYGSHTVDVYLDKTEAVRAAKDLASEEKAEETTEEDHTSGYDCVISFAVDYHPGWMAITVEERETKPAKPKGTIHWPKKFGPFGDHAEQESPNHIRLAWEVLNFQVEQGLAVSRRLDDNFEAVVNIECPSKPNKVLLDGRAPKLCQGLRYHPDQWVYLWDRVPASQLKGCLTIELSNSTIEIS